MLRAVVVARSLGVLAAASLALSACTAAPAPPILSEGGRAAIRGELTAQARALLVGLDGSAAEPGYDFGATVADHDWPAAMTRCLLTAGFTVSVAGSEVRYLSGSGQTQAEFAAARYRCALAHPRVSEVALYLDPVQLGAIYDYYTRFVVPCLRLTGASTTTPPTREEFVGEFFAFPWHPFDAVWSTDPGDSRVAELEVACPPVPAWLDLGS